MITFKTGNRDEACQCCTRQDRAKRYGVRYFEIKYAASEDSNATVLSICNTCLAELIGKGAAALSWTAIVAVESQASNEPQLGDKAICASCDRPIYYNGEHWVHEGTAQPRHPGRPKE